MVSGELDFLRNMSKYLLSMFQKGVHIMELVASGEALNI